MEEGELMMPPYRVRVSVVPGDVEEVPDGHTDRDDGPVSQAVAQPMPEGTYVQNLTLRLQPDDSLIEAPEGALVIYMPPQAPEDREDGTKEDLPAVPGELRPDAPVPGQPVAAADGSVVTPARFVAEDGEMVAWHPVEADGLYAVRAPEDWDPEDYMPDDTDGFSDAVEEDDFEDDWDDDLEEDDIEDGFQ